MEEELEPPNKSSVTYYNMKKFIEQINVKAQEANSKKDELDPTISQQPNSLND